MTEATLTQHTRPQQAAPTLNYQVSLTQPSSHLFEVMLRVTGWQKTTLDLKFPVWTPGSYLVREYARHLQEFRACDGEETPLNARKLNKNHWQIETAGVSTVVVRYRIYAAELTVRTNHLDATHGYFNGAAIFFRLPGFEKTPIQVRIVPPSPEWRVTTPLPQVSGYAHTFEAADFDTLVDSPFEIGTHRTYYFEVLGKPHELAIWGQGNEQPEQIVRDITKIVQTEAQLFGGLPYDRYVFLLHLVSHAMGGLEHKDGCSLIYQRFGFRAPDKYQRFLQLVAHEFFHLWNVKRLRPKELEVFDYDGENYTPSLWFCEGTTSYYDLLLPLRAGIYDAKTFLAELGKEITRLQTTPGRLVQPLSESSWDAWIKLYRPDANSGNSQISYYLKGELVSLLLDLLIRAQHENRRSLDDVMRQMWEEFGKPEVGFTAEQLQQRISTIAEVDLTEFFERYLETTEELPFNRYLKPFGLRLESDRDEASSPGVPFLGLTVKTENGKAMVKSAIAHSPAQNAGIDAGDELLAINEIRVTAEQLSDRLQDFAAGYTIRVSAFHQDTLITVPVTLSEPQPTRYQLVPVENPTPQQQQLFQGWLGVPLKSVL
ncbi:MAG: M61 family metallopeptidase [Desertifilum sp. SIO1I2]|nr:M61 family metallopeptidase [Desertifilum sp. SIO1I2]